MGTGSSSGNDQTGFAHFETEGGLDVLIRLGSPDDEELLLEGFERLSDQSRYQRFFAATPHLSPSTVDRLLNVGARHVVLVALVPDDDGDGDRDPAGGIRAVWLDAEPGTAEMAVTVIDAYQGRGLGTLLTAAVAAVCVDRGVTTLVADVLAVNEAMLGVLRSFEADVERREGDGTVVTARFDAERAARRLPSPQRNALLAAVSRSEHDRAEPGETG